MAQTTIPDRPKVVCAEGTVTRRRVWAPCAVRIDIEVRGPCHGRQSCPGQNRVQHPGIVVRLQHVCHHIEPAVVVQVKVDLLFGQSRFPWTLLSVAVRVMPHVASDRRRSVRPGSDPSTVISPQQIAVPRVIGKFRTANGIVEVPQCTRLLIGLIGRRGGRSRDEPIHGGQTHFVNPLHPASQDGSVRLSVPANPYRLGRVVHKKRPSRPRIESRLGDQQSSVDKDVGDRPFLGQ